MMSGTFNGGPSVRTNTTTTTTAAAPSPYHTNGSNGMGTTTTIASNLATLREQPAHNGGERFRDIPELVETGPGIGQCITMRTDALGSYQQLGPPDLVHVIKTSQSGKNTKEFSGYHFVSGVDVSSSASVAAYINSLTYSLERSVGWLKGNPWRVTRSIYCTYNAFSGQDIRVEARIPGGITAYAIGANGTKMATTPDMWHEVFVSSILRSIFMHGGGGTGGECWGNWWGGFPSGNGNNSGTIITMPSLSHSLHDDAAGWVAIRKLDPLPSSAVEERFLDTCARLIKSAWCLGSAQGHPTGDALNNFLTQGILRHFVVNCRRPIVARTFFERPAVAAVLGADAQTAILASCLLVEEREPEAIRRLVEIISREPSRSPACLLVQGAFLADRGRYEETLLVAREAVRSSPLDYFAWVTLAQAHIYHEQYAQALRSLNGCPLTLSPEPISWTVSPGTKLWTPTRNIQASDTGGRSNGSTRPKAKSGGTTSTTTSTAAAATTPSNPSISPVTSVTSMSGQSSLSLLAPLALDMVSSPGLTPSSTMLERLKGHRLRGAITVAYQVLVGLEKAVGWDELLQIRSRIFIMEEEYRQQQQQAQQPSHTGVACNAEITYNGRMEDSMEQIPLDEDGSNTTGSGQLVHGKRMCEKWLDSLFMILFEDLRLYTLLQGELVKARQDPSGRGVQRSARDWLLLGHLCSRLQRPEEAKEAYRRCVEATGGAWCQAAWLALLARYTGEGRLGSALTAAGRILLYETALCQEVPVQTSPVARFLMQLVRDQGLERCRTTLIGLNLGPQADGLIQGYFEVAMETKSIGYDY